MSEDSSEKGIPRRGFLALLGLGGVGLAIGADRWAKSQEEPTNPENLETFLGAAELFPGFHANYRGKVLLKEGTAIYKSPSRENPEASPGIPTTNIGGRTLQGTLGRGEVLAAENPFLFLREAGEFTDPTWARSVTGPTGLVKNYNAKSSWVIFDVKNSELPDSVKGLYPNGVACAPLEGVSLDFGGNSLPASNDIIFSREIKFGKVVS